MGNISEKSLAKKSPRYGEHIKKTAARKIQPGTLLRHSDNFHDDEVVVEEENQYGFVQNHFLNKERYIGSKT